jgi:hypothetical protein
MEIFKTIFGSHLYGTNTDKSDLDLKGIGLPTIDQILHEEKTGKKMKIIYRHSTGKNNNKNTSEDVDTEIYSLKYFIELALEGQTVALDMLHAPKEFWMLHHLLWYYIYSNRSSFYSKNLHSFIGYARRQAAKYGLKGSRLANVQEVIQWMEQQISKYGPRTKLRDADLDTFPKGDYIKWLEAPDSSTAHPDLQIIPSVKICEKTFTVTTPLNFILAPLVKYDSEYGVRARQAKDNANIDWKAISHAFRAAYQVRELFTKGTITFPLKEAQELIQIKLGILDYSELETKLEELIQEVLELKDNSGLPEEPNKDIWNGFVEDTYLAVKSGKYK